mmetsp:Transcript_19953/g.63469  ORF Transcript_19953/g.63469 Transcript_19953/m.63469 type:complete len:238 (+) Transcript_19953:280-993(+)
MSLTSLLRMLRYSRCRAAPMPCSSTRSLSSTFSERRLGMVSMPSMEMMSLDLRERLSRPLFRHQEKRSERRSPSPLVKHGLRQQARGMPRMPTTIASTNSPSASASEADVSSVNSVTNSGGESDDPPASRPAPRGDSAVAHRTVSTRLSKPSLVRKLAVSGTSRVMGPRMRTSHPLSSRRHCAVGSPAQLPRTPDRKPLSVRAPIQPARETTCTTVMSASAPRPRHPYGVRYGRGPM